MGMINSTLKKVGSFLTSLAIALFFVSVILAVSWGNYKEYQERQILFASAVKESGQGNLAGAIANLEKDYASYEYWLSRPRYERTVREMLISYSEKLRDEASTQSEEMAKKTRELARHYEVTAKGRYD